MTITTWLVVTKSEEGDMGISISVVFYNQTEEEPEERAGVLFFNR